MIEEDMIFLFPNPANHPDWTLPQSNEFYARLVEETGEYNYPWHSTFDGQTAEGILEQNILFTNNYFDVAFTKKGPTDWYQEGNRIVKPGGLVCGLYHGGTDGGLRSLFPGLYSPAGEINFTRAIEKLKENLRIGESGLSEIHIQPIEEVEYLVSPEDVLKKKCFGQSEKLKEYVWRECLRGVEEIFHKNATSKGLKVINYYYLVKARAT